MWKQTIHKSIQHNQLEPEATVRDGSIIGENRHVWRPKEQPKLTDVVASLSSQKKQKQSQGVSQLPAPTSKI